MSVAREVAAYAKAVLLYTTETLLGKSLCVVVSRLDIHLQLR